MNCNCGLPDCPICYRINVESPNESISTTNVGAYMNYMEPIIRMDESSEQPFTVNYDNYSRMRELATNQRQNFQSYWYVPSDRSVRFELIYFLIVKVAATYDKILIPRKPYVFDFLYSRLFFFFYLNCKLTNFFIKKKEILLRR